MTSDLGKYDVVIAGAGPAGLATALNLLRNHPELRGHVVALEKARHPRSKICAGGLIPRTITALEELALERKIPAIEVFGGRARTEAGTIALPPSPQPLCTIVRRDEFDTMLARRAQHCGLELLEDTSIISIEPQAAAVRVTTERGVLEGRVLVGADGSASRVRSQLFGPSGDNIGRALMADIPVDSSCAEEFVSRLYRFDFNCIAAGIRGYCWSFPCLVNGQTCLNLGIYDEGTDHSARRAPRAELLRHLCAAFPVVRTALERKPLELKGFPIRWYRREDRYVCGRTLLAGDAAGVDPLLGEGISCAFEHGKLAAGAIARYLGGDSRALEVYGEQLHHGMLGRKLRRLGFAARRFYGRHHHFYFRLAALSTVAQRIGVDWYNGFAATDELSIAAAVFRFFCDLMLKGARQQRSP